MLYIVWRQFKVYGKICIGYVHITYIAIAINRRNLGVCGFWCLQVSWNQCPGTPRDTRVNMQGFVDINTLTLRILKSVLTNIHFPMRMLHTCLKYSLQTFLERSGYVSRFDHLVYIVPLQLGECFIASQTISSA